MEQLIGTPEGRSGGKGEAGAGAIRLDRLQSALASTRAARVRGDQGSALVEFAFIAPLLVALVCGIIDFSYAFAQQLDVRHGAREGARLAAVDYRSTPTATGSTQTAQIVSATCGEMSFGKGATIALSFDSGSTTRGSFSTVTISKPVRQLTNFYSWVLNGKSVSSSVKFRLEMDVSWASNSSSPGVCP